MKMNDKPTEPEEEPFSERVSNSDARVKAFAEKDEENKLIEKVRWLERVMTIFAIIVVIAHIVPAVQNYQADQERIAQEQAIIQDQADRAEVYKVCQNGFNNWGSNEGIVFFQGNWVCGGNSTLRVFFNYKDRWNGTWLCSKNVTRQRLATNQQTDSNGDIWVSHTPRFENYTAQIFRGCE
jgi:hypothetical protein